MFAVAAVSERKIFMFQLIPFQKEDFSYFTQLVYQEEVMKMNMGRTFSEEEATWFFQTIVMSDTGKKPLVGWYKVFSQSEEYIGIFGFFQREDGFELEYMLLPAFWGKGYATLIVREFLAEVKISYPTAKVVAITDPENVASVRVLEKNGFCWERNFTNDDGESVSLYNIQFES